jgi:hypothetical protein
VARGGVRSVVWDFDGGEFERRGGLGGRRIVQRIRGHATREIAQEREWSRFEGRMGVDGVNGLVNGSVLEHVKEVEVCIPPVKRICGNCMLKWLGMLLSEGSKVEQILLRVGVQKVGVGQWSRLANARERPETVKEILGAWSSMRTLVTDSKKTSRCRRPVRLLVEAAVMCGVKMSCSRRVGRPCGADCFADNFLVSLKMMISRKASSANMVQYCVIDLNDMKIIESKTQRCAQTIAAQDLHRRHRAGEASMRGKESILTIRTSSSRPLKK